MFEIDPIVLNTIRGRAYKEEVKLEMRLLVL